MSHRRSGSFLWAAILALVIILPLAPAQAAGDPLPELFGATHTSADAALTAPHEMRVRQAALHLTEVERARSALDGGSTSYALALNLFADTRLVAHFERDEPAPGGYVLSGAIEDSLFGEIHLSVTGSALDASIHSDQGLFRISSADGQSAHIIQVDPRLFPPEEEAIPPAPMETAPLPAPMAAASGASSTDDGSRIDVYVGYTSAARAAAGSTAAMQNLINIAISETNSGYANSGISQRVVLVGSGEYHDDESAFNWGRTLERWSDPSDPTFAAAHVLRDTLRADEMVLLVNDLNYCGLAWLMRRTSDNPMVASGSFAVVSRTCATGYYSFAHEMGHNMGAHHDRYSANGGFGADPWSYGYWIFNPDTYQYDVRTIMAYNTADYYGYNATRINRWSNPSLSYNGQPTGVAHASPQSADNAATLNVSAPSVAQFRDGASPTAPVNLAVIGLGAQFAQLDWDNSALDVMRNRVERSPAGENIWSELAVLDAATTGYTDNSLPASGAFDYRVLADNGNGRTASATVLVTTPASPTALTIRPAGAGAVRLSWTDQASQEDGYLIERAPVGGPFTALVTLPGANQGGYTDTALPASGEYQYRVAAYNGRGSSPFTAPADLLAQPGTLTSTPTQPHQMQLTWVDRSVRETSYHVDRSLDGGLTWLPVSILSANATGFTDSAACGTSLYGVAAANDGGSSAYVVSEPAYFPPCPPVPSAVARTTSIGLTWPPASGAQGYTVERWDMSTSSFIVMKTLGLSDARVYLVTGLEPTTTYRFRVVAKNEDLGDTASAPLDVTTASYEFFAPLVQR